MSNTQSVPPQPTFQQANNLSQIKLSGKTIILCLKVLCKEQKISRARITSLEYITTHFYSGTILKSQSPAQPYCVSSRQTQKEALVPSPKCLWYHATNQGGDHKCHITLLYLLQVLSMPSSPCNLHTFQQKPQQQDCHPLLMDTSTLHMAYSFSLMCLSFGEEHVYGSAKFLMETAEGSSRKLVFIHWHASPLRWRAPFLLKQQNYQPGA